MPVYSVTLHHPLSDVPDVPRLVVANNPHQALRHVSKKIMTVKVLKAEEALRLAKGCPPEDARAETE